MKALLRMLFSIIVFIFLFFGGKVLGLLLEFYPSVGIILLSILIFLGLFVPLFVRKIKKNKIKKAAETEKIMQQKNAEQAYRIDLILKSDMFLGKKYKTIINEALQGELLLVSSSGYFAMRTNETAKVFITKSRDINSVNYDSEENTLIVELNDFNTPIIKFTSLNKLTAKDQHALLVSLLNNFQSSNN